MDKYSHISTIGNINSGYNNMQISERTQNKRNQLKASLDNFTSFTWRGINGFEAFGAFIINNKGGSLKFYNGPTWTNEYTKPQFESATGQLTGLTFQTQKIDFQIGVYWFTEDQYRQLIYWLNPYEINTLTFDFEKRYYYQVKLASVDNGIRYIIGHEDKEPMYYTEMKLTFEVQGPACVYAKIPYSIKSITQTQGNPATLLSLTQSIKLKETTQQMFDDEFVSDLSFPFEDAFVFDFDAIELPKERSDATELPKEISDAKLYIQSSIWYDNEEQLLFSVSLKNLTYFNQKAFQSSPHEMHLIYNSEDGLIYLETADNENILLNALTTNSSGKRIVDSILTSKATIRGKFECPDIDYTKWKIITTCSITYIDENNETQTYRFENTNFLPQYSSGSSRSRLEARARSNLI